MTPTFLQETNFPTITMVNYSGTFSIVLLCAQPMSHVIRLRHSLFAGMVHPFISCHQCYFDQLPLVARLLPSASLVRRLFHVRAYLLAANDTKVSLWSPVRRMESLFHPLFTASRQMTQRFQVCHFGPLSGGWNPYSILYLRLRRLTISRTSTSGTEPIQDVAYTEYYSAANTSIIANKATRPISHRPMTCLDGQYPATVNPPSGELVFDTSMKMVKSRKLRPRSRSERISSKLLKQMGGACKKHKNSKKKVRAITTRNDYANVTEVSMLSGHQCFELMYETFGNIEGRNTVSNW